MASGLEVRANLAAQVWPPAGVRRARPPERRQGAVGDLAGAVALAGRTGLLTHRRRVVRRRSSRRPRRLAQGKSVFAWSQLGDCDGAGAADLLLGVAAL